MDLISIGVNSDTHEISVTEDSPQSRIDRYWTQIEVVLPEEMEGYSVRMDFELPVTKEDGTNFYPFTWLTQVPYVIPPKILLAADNQGIPIRLFFTKTEPVTGVTESWASTNSLILEVDNARKMEIDDPGWLLDLGYENAFVHAVIDWQTKTVTLTQIDGDETILDFTEMFAKSGLVSYDTVQDLTDEEENTARTNIGAASAKDYHALDGSNFAWDSERGYTKDAITVIGNEIFKSTSDNNTGHDPLEEGTIWWINFLADAQEPISKFFIIGNGEDTEFVLNHNFGTKVFFHEIIEVDAPYEHPETTVISESLNTCRVKFANPPYINQYMVLLSPTGGALTETAQFTFEQITASTTWTIVHNMQKNVTVSCFNSEGERIFGTEYQTDPNTYTVTFFEAVAGYAVVI